MFVLLFLPIIENWCKGSDDSFDAEMMVNKKLHQLSQADAETLIKKIILHLFPSEFYELLLMI